MDDTRLYEVIKHMFKCFHDLYDLSLVQQSVNLGSQHWSKIFSYALSTKIYKHHYNHIKNVDSWMNSSCLYDKDVDMTKSLVSTTQKDARCDSCSTKGARCDSCSTKGVPINQQNCDISPPWAYYHQPNH